jgi:predicted nucleic acid-binding protein
VNSDTNFVFHEIHVMKNVTVTLDSVQMLQEFYVTGARKLRPGLSATEAQREVRALLPWSPIESSPTILERAWFVEPRHQLSWWDARIVASVQPLGCRTLLTEDRQHGQDFDGLVVVSPLRVSPSQRFDRR